MAVDAAQCEFGALLGRAGVVVFGPAGADEEDVADLDVAALGGGEDVDTLGFPTCFELVEGNGVRSGGVVGDGLAGGVGAVVEEDAAAGEAVAGPVVDAAFVVVGDAFAVEVGGPAAVVEGFCGDVCHVSESVPLSAGLGVHGIQIVVCDGRVQRLDRVFELLASERGFEGDVEREVETSHFACLDLAGGSLDPGGCEEVETSHIVVMPPNPRCIFRSTGDTW